jgi:hypothetical protein
VLNAVAIENACEASFAQNKAACSSFVSAVCARLGVELPAGDANQLVRHLARPENGWTELRRGDGVGAYRAAAAGRLVIAGLTGEEHEDRRRSGHVAVILGTLPPDGRGAPMAYWGSTTPGIARARASLRFSWRAADLQRVRYFAR